MNHCRIGRVRWKNVVALKPQCEMSSAQCLSMVQYEHFDEVVVIGLDYDEGLFTRNSKMGRDRFVWVLDMAKMQMLRPYLEEQLDELNVVRG